MVGATPVFADIDRSLNLDPDDFERKITANTKAVIVVHFQGATNDMDRVLEIAARHGIAVVEDCAQSCGAVYKGVKVGALGDVACFSLQQNKIMTTGDGGLLLARDPVVFERAARFHDLGGVRTALKEQLGGELRGQSFCGCQLRMNEVTGAVALAQLRKLDRDVLNVTRRHFRNLKTRIQAECPDLQYRDTGDDAGDAGIAFYMDLGTPERAQWFTQAMTAEGIRIGPSSGCCNLLHHEPITTKAQVHPALPPFGPGWPGEAVEYSVDLCPNTDVIFKSMACVALVPAFTDEDVRDVGAAVAKVWRARPWSQE